MIEAQRRVQFAGGKAKSSPGSSLVAPIFLGVT
jgi:hypothetical protein